MSDLRALLRASVLASALIAPLALAGQATAHEHVEETVIYSFTGINGDGDAPRGPLVAQTSGFGRSVEALLGVTAGGGARQRGTDDR